MENLQTRKCILCWIKFLNSTPKSHSSYLAELCGNQDAKPRRHFMCDVCKANPLAQKFNFLDAAQIEANGKKSYTLYRYGFITIKEKYAKVDPKELHEALRWAIRKRIRQSKIPNSIYLVPELQPNTLHIHWHGYYVGSRAVGASINAILSKLGFISIKPLYDLNGWLDYCHSEGEHEKKQPYALVTPHGDYTPIMECS